MDERERILKSVKKNNGFNMPSSLKDTNQKDFTTFYFVNDIF